MKSIAPIFRPSSSFRCRTLFGFAMACVFTTLLSQAFAADSIEPSAKLPASIPWDLEQMSRAPRIEWIDTEGPVRSLFYEGEAYDGKPTRIFAYYATPATVGNRFAEEKRFPGVVLLHGGGGTAFREWALLWANRGYAAIAMDLTGHRPREGANAHDPKNRDRLPDGGPNQAIEVFGHVDKAPTEQWPYHAVAAAIRAHSLLRSFPEVDEERTAVTGISWGGYLTSIVAGIDSRFKAAVPVYGCGYLQENSAWLKDFEKMNADQRARWVKLWDPSNYLPAVMMPILFINGTNDAAYPLDSYMKSYALVPGEKHLCITVNMPHSHTDGWAPAEIGQFIGAHLRDGRPLPKLGALQSTKGHITLKHASKGDTKAALHFTTGREPINKRQWTSLPATVSKDSVIADTPPNDATAWFITVTEGGQSTVSSEVVFPKNTTAMPANE